MARPLPSSFVAPLARPSSATLGLASPAAQLSLAGLAIAVLFGVFLVAPLPVWAGHPSAPPADGAASFEPVGWGGAALMAAFSLSMCLPFRPYHLAQRALRQARVANRLLFGLTALVALAGLLIYPAFGSDLFDYVGFARAWAVYGDNPLAALPIHHPQDWSTPFVWYPDRTPAYGPLWALLAWPIVQLAGDSPALEVVGFKVLSSLAYAACCWLIWDLLPPARRQRGLVAFAWSPLILFEVLGKVHNDILPALSVLAAVWLLAPRRAPHLSLAAGIVGALVKITALAAAPPLAASLWRRSRWRGLLPASAVALAVALALYAPFWQGPQTLAPIWNQTSRIVWSPAALLVLLSNLLPGGPHTELVRAACGLVCATAGGLLVVRSRLSSPGELATASGWILLLSVLLLTSAVYGHYFIPAVALAAVSEDARLRRLVFWLSLGGLAAYGVELLGLALGPAWLGSDPYRVVGSLILVGPAAAALIGRCVRIPRRGPGAAAP